MEPILKNTPEPLAKLSCKTIEKIGGAEGTRTPDPLNAIQVLFQLSYSPTHHPAMESTSRRLTSISFSS